MGLTENEIIKNNRNNIEEQFYRCAHGFYNLLFPFLKKPSIQLSSASNRFLLQFELKLEKNNYNYNNHNVHHRTLLPSTKDTTQYFHNTRSNIEKEILFHLTTISSFLTN